MIQPAQTRLATGSLFPPIGMLRKTELTSQYRLTHAVDVDTIPGSPAPQTPSSSTVHVRYVNKAKYLSQLCLHMNAVDEQRPADKWNCFGFRLLHMTCSA